MATITPPTPWAELEKNKQWRPHVTPVHEGEMILWLVNRQLGSRWPEADELMIDSLIESRAMVRDGNDEARKVATLMLMAHDLDPAAFRSLCACCFQLAIWQRETHGL